MSASPQTIRPSPHAGPLDDIVLRRPQPIASLPATDPELNIVYEYWNSCRRDGLLPRRKDIDVLQLKPVLGHMHIVDVTAQDPSDYRYRLYGSKVRLNRFSNYTNTRLGDLPSLPYRNALIDDYSAVAWSGTPLYQNVVARLQSIRYSYSRLLLPLAEDGRRVNMLIVSTHDRVFPDFTA
ncbi:MAG: PAS domain-containing protein [Alphaproteobacteria bacterium]|nr:PAS domain-containing protein [Alphaproteobacteria bacterium]